MATTAKQQKNSKTCSAMDKPDASERGTEDYPLAASDSNYDAVAMQDFHRLMEAFTNQIRLAVPCDGIKFRANNMNRHFSAGTMDHYLCCFEIRIGAKSFGTIYFARATQFMDYELTILENMVAGLVMPLCHLFQTDLCDDNTESRDATDQQVSITGAAHQQ